MPKYSIRPTSVGALARGANYNIKDLGGNDRGFTDLLKLELGVSRDADAPDTRWNQLHELGHVKRSLWSVERIAHYARKRGLAVTTAQIQAAEDARINELVLRSVPDAHEGFALPNLDIAKKYLPGEEGYVSAHCAPVTLKCLLGRSLAPDRQGRLDDQLAKLRSMPTKELTVLNVTLPLAELIEIVKSDKPDGKGGGKGGGKGDKPPKGKSAGMGDPSEEPSDGGDFEALGEPDAHYAHSGTPCGRTDTERPEAERPWVIPKVDEPPLTVIQNRGNFAVATAETGTAIRWPHLYRISTDGVIFRRNKRRPGALQRGTVLIDGSGSMRLSDEMIAEMIDMLPYATIAIYSGGGGAGHSWIVIVARNGRRVERIGSIERDGGNTCDGPALLWLSRQQAPRLWICDGIVTGEHDALKDPEECAVIMKAAGIVQVVGNPLVATRTMERHHTAINTAQFKKVLKDVERGRVSQ